MTLPIEAKARKAIPVYTGFIKYFPDAIIAVAELSAVANEQHNPGQPIHWAKEKSQDELDALARHMIDDVTAPGSADTDDILHATKIAWRGMANLQRILDKKKQTIKDVEEIKSASLYSTIHDSANDTSSIFNWLNIPGEWNVSSNGEGDVGTFTPTLTGHTGPKIGDRVRCIVELDDLLGLAGTVVGFESGSLWPVIVDFGIKGDRKAPLKLDELERVEPRIGGKVRFTDKCPSWRGTGVITGFHDPNMNLFWVQCEHDDDKHGVGAFLPDELELL